MLKYLNRLDVIIVTIQRFDLPKASGVVIKIFGAIFKDNTSITGYALSIAVGFENVALA